MTDTGNGRYSEIRQSGSHFFVNRTQNFRMDMAGIKAKFRMDSLKAAADKIRNSPRLMKKKIDEALHKDSRIPDDWITNRENVQRGVTFNVKNLGKQTTEVAQGTGCTDKIVIELVVSAEKNKKMASDFKLQKLSMTVNNKKLVIKDAVTHDIVEEIPVHRISYCTADPNYPKVFAFIAKQKGAKEMYAYALLTNKKAMAEAIALTVAQAFTMAFEEWQEKRKADQTQVEDLQQEQAAFLYADLSANPEADQKKCAKPELKLDKPRFHPTNPFRAPENEDEGLQFVSQTLSTRLDQMVISEPEDVRHSELDEPDGVRHASSDEDDEFQIFAQERSRNPRATLNTGLVRRATFKGNVVDYLSVNNTLADISLSKSTEDLFSASGSSPPASPPSSPSPRVPVLIPSPQPEPRRNRQAHPRDDRGKESENLLIQF